MPIYEYRCSECGHELEKLQKMSDPPLTECPACGRNSLQKRVSAAGFRLKGGGWYETDFKGKNRKNVAKEEGGAKSEAKTDGASKSETNTASKGTKAAASGDKKTD
jgi:putative FmdB family regulatory protein